MVKLADIVARTGLSRMTVSSVLNGREGKIGISHATAERVRQVCRELGYIPNQMAISNRLGLRPVVGAMLSHLREPFVARTLSGIAQAINGRGMLLKIEEVSGDAQEARALKNFTSHRVAGILFCNVNPLGDLPRMVRETARLYHCPFVGTSSDLGQDCHRVESDDEDGFRQAIRHLVQSGHRSFCYVGLNYPGRHASTRWQSFASAWKIDGEGLRLREIRAMRGTTDMLERVRQELKRKKGRATAFLCGSDNRAAQVIQEARRLGVDVPGDVSVVGFADQGFGELLEPPLTTIIQPFEKIGMRCAEVLFDLTGRDASSTDSGWIHEKLPTKLVVRSSSGPVQEHPARTPRR